MIYTIRKVLLGSAIAMAILGSAALGSYHWRTQHYMELEDVSITTEGCMKQSDNFDGLPFPFCEVPWVRVQGYDQKICYDRDRFTLMKGTTVDSLLVNEENSEDDCARVISGTYTIYNL